MQDNLLGFIALRAKVALLNQIADLMEASPPLSDLEINDAFHAMVVAGVKKSELARCFSVDVTTVNDWVQCRKVPPHAARQAYAKHLVKIARRHTAMWAVACGAGTVAKAA